MWLLENSTRRSRRGSFTRTDQPTLPEGAALVRSTATGQFVRLARLCVVVTLGLIGPALPLSPGTAGAEPLQLGSDYILVISVDDSDLIEDPASVDGCLEFRTELGSAEVCSPNLSIVAVMFGGSRRSSPDDRSGPWWVYVDSESTIEDVLAELEAANRIVEARSADEDTELLTEVVRSEFPDLVNSDLFYESEGSRYWHLVRPEGEEGVHLRDPSTRTEAWASEWDVDAPQAWGISRGEEIIIAVWDPYGVQIGHPDLIDQILVNEADPPGDLNADECPGICDVDDNGNGIVDEDRHMRPKSNTPEYFTFPDSLPDNIEVLEIERIPVATQYTVLTSHTWSTDELRGWYLTMRSLQAPCEGVLDQRSIIGNDPTDSMGYTRLHLNSSVNIDSDLHTFTISNGHDDDEDGDRDDLGEWCEVAALDDDENGYADDTRGWNFFAHNSHVEFIDSMASHGTFIAGIIAASESGQMVGLSPRVKILPLVTGGFDTEALDYAKSRGASIFTSSVKRVPASFSLHATEDLGMIYVQAGGNGQSTVPQPSYANPRAILVGGVMHNRWPWRGGNGSGSAYYPRINLLAPAFEVIVAAVDTNLNYTWRGENGTGTSVAAPFVAATCALVKSTYPNWSNDMITSKVIGSTDPYRPFDLQWSGYMGQGMSQAQLDVLNAQYEGNLGSGIVNPYKALTFYGDVWPHDEPIVTWSGTVYISGDLTIPAGRELKLEPGTVVKIAVDDILNSRDPHRIDWTIDGQLTSLGTPGSPVVFEILADDPPIAYLDNPNRQWGHIRVKDYDDVTLDNIEFLDRMPIDDINSPAVLAIAEGGTLTLKWSKLHITNYDQTFTYEDSVRVCTSIDGGDTFDAGIRASIHDTSIVWTAPSGSAGADVVLRWEVIDPDGYIIGFSYHEVLVPAVAMQFDDETTAASLATPGTPYAASFRDYSIGGNPAFAVSREDDATIHNRRTGVASGIPQHQNEALTVGFQPTTAERGMASADYDSDGDIDLFVAHATLPRLYNFDASRSPKYVDVSSSVIVGANSLRSVTQDSWSGSWADYDGDGYPDLYVTRAEAPSPPEFSHSPASIDGKGLKDVLLRNLGYAGVGFEDVTVAAGLYDADSETVSASWADIDNDGDFDLYVCWLGAYHGNFTVGWSPLYLNNRDTAVFEDITLPAGQVPYLPAPKFPRLGFVNGSAWGDLNSDGFLDIALARQNTSGQGILENVKVYINEGATTLGDLSGEPAGLPTSTVAMRDLRIHDLDNNTKPDLIYTPVGTETEQIYMGYQAQSNEVWVEQAAALGVTGASGQAIMAADLNGDGDIDLYLGRGSSQTTYFQNRAAGGGEGPTNNFLRVALQNHAVVGGTWNSGNAVEGISARVLVECPAAGGLPAWKQSLVMDGGTGLGGQDDRLLNIGLGQYEAGTVTVFWPDGATTQSAFDSSDVNETTPLYIEDVHSPGLNGGSVVATAQPRIGAEQVWVFEWKTAFTSNESLDRVVLRPKPNKQGVVPPECQRPEITLTPDDLDVTHTVIVDGTALLHRLEWQADWCDGGCAYTFDVYSKLGDNEDQELLTTITIPLCIY